MIRARSIIKKTVRWLVIVGATLACLTAGAVIFLSLSPGENILKGVLEKQLSGSLGQPVRIDRLETNVFSRLVLHDIRLFGDSADSGAPVLAVHDLRADYRLWPLIHKEISVRNVTIDSMDMNLSRDAAGEYNFGVLNDTAVETSGDAPSASSSYILSLGSVHLGHLSVKYSDATLPASFIIEDGSIGVKGDSAGGYGFILSLAPIGAVYDSVPVRATELTIDGYYADDIVRVDSLRMRAEDMRLSASGSVSLDSMGDLSGRLELAGKPDSLLRQIGRRFEFPEISLKDDFTLRAEIGGSTEAPDITTRLDLPETDVSGTGLKRGFILARWHADSIHVDSLSFDGFGGSVYGTAEALIDSIPQARAELFLSDIDVSALWQYAYHEPSPYTGRLQGTMLISGAGRDISGWDANASFRATHATYRSQPFPDFSAAVAWSNGSGEMQMEQDDFTITAQGRYQNERINGRYGVDIRRLQPLAEFLDLHELSGIVTASGTFDGTIDNPSVTADVNASAIRYQNFPVDSLMGSFEYEDSVLTIKAMRFTGTVAAIDPQHPPFHIDSIEGGFSYRGQISGRLDSLTGGVTAGVHRARFREYLLDSAEVVAYIVGRDVLVDSAWAFRHTEFIRGDGRYNIDQAAGSVALALYDLRDTTRQMDSAHGMRVGSFGRIDASFDLSDTTSMRIKASGDSVDIGRMAAMFSDSLDVGGILSFHADLSGTMAAPTGSMDIFAAHPYYGEYVLDSITTDVEVDTGIVTVNRFASFGAGRRMTAQGSLALGRDSTGAPVIVPTSRTRGRIEAEAVDLATFNPFLTETATLHGYAGVHIEWNGTIRDPHATGTVGLDSCSLVMADGIDSVYNIGLRGSLEDSTLTIDTASGILLREPFTMHGTVTASQWKRFIADVDIVLKRLGTVAVSGEMAPDSVALTANIERLEMDLLQPFVPDVDSLSGTLACRIDVTGTPEDIRLFGDVAINDLVVQSSLISTPITGGVVRVSFDKNLITIDTLYARFGGGPVAVSGTLTQDAGDITDVNLKLSADSVEISRPKQFTAAVERARLTYARQNDYYLLDGDVQLGDSRLTMNFPFTSILPWAQSVEQVSTEYTPLLQKTRMNVRVRESQNLWVDNNLAKLRLHSELALIGSVPRPNLSGRITVEEGYLLYLDRKFKVTSGSAYFVDPVHFNPEIDFQATTTVTTYQALTSTTYTITLSARGSLDDLRIDLISDPVLDKADIVSLLTLGATREQLAGKNGAEEGGVQGVLTRRAEALTSQRVTGFVSGKIGALLGLDQVTVQGNLFNLKGENAPQITATKMLSQRMKLTYSTTVGHLNDESIQLGYQLSRRFFLEGRTDRAGNSSLDLKHRLLFR